LADFWNFAVYPFRFPDTNLSKIVRCARHAISIDDERRTFHPELWNEPPEQTDANDRTIEQVWFAGVHSNVGGGYPKQGLSLVPLVWMMREAEKRGLRFVPSARKQFEELQNVFDKLYDSRAGLAGYYAYKPRNIAEICKKYNAPARIHVSVLERIALGTGGYAPGNLPFSNRECPPEIITEDPSRDLSEAKRIISGLFDDENKAKLLASGKPYVALWRWSQGAFVVASLLTFGLYVDRFEWKSLATIVSFETLRNATELFGANLWLVAALLVPYLLCYVAAGVLRRKYSEFWFGSRQSLREALFNKVPAPTPPDGSKSKAAASGT
jgi:hypothetical protein